MTYVHNFIHHNPPLTTRKLALINLLPGVSILCLYFVFVFCFCIYFVLVFCACISDPTSNLTYVSRFSATCNKMS